MRVSSRENSDSRPDCSALGYCECDRDDQGRVIGGHGRHAHDRGHAIVARPCHEVRKAARISHEQRLTVDRAGRQKPGARLGDDNGARHIVDRKDGRRGAAARCEGVVALHARQRVAQRVAEVLVQRCDCTNDRATCRVLTHAESEQGRREPRRFINIHHSQRTQRGHACAVGIRRAYRHIETRRALEV